MYVYKSVWVKSACYSLKFIITLYVYTKMIGIVVGEK